jgi:NTE family protein
MLAFSGGGTRAAAFAYGVLKELAATEVVTEKGPRPLHHEVDVISSVSGGSFTAAYFGLKGDGIFEDFEERFLRKNIQGNLVWRSLAPRNWFKQMSRKVGRSDIAAEYYSKNLFDGATFADLQRPDAPVLVINATDLVSGVRFPFFRQYFDMICADMDKYPVSRAVAASSAVPGLLSPIGLENYAGSCGYQPSERLTQDAEDERVTFRGDEARALLGYLDAKKRPWLHLVDGGIADNLGLRAYYNRLSLTESLAAAFLGDEHKGARNILLILVDSRVTTAPAWALYAKIPSLMQVIGSVSGIELARYDIDTIQLVRDSFEKGAEESSKPGSPVTFDFVDVHFGAVKDEKQRAVLNKVGTNFHIEDEQADALIAAGRQVLRESPAFQVFLARNRSGGHSK